MKKIYLELVFLVIISAFILIGISAYSNFMLTTLNKNPFDDIRSSEERIFINGTIIHVEYINEFYANDDYCILFIDNLQYHWSKDSFSDLKRHEGETVSIMCYVQTYDGNHRLYPCNDWEMGYIKEEKNVPTYN